MSKDEFKIRAQEMGYSDEFINETIEDHEKDKYALPYENYLIGKFDNYPSNSF